MGKAEVSILVRSGETDWTMLGAETARGIWPESVTLAANEAGPDTASFMLRRRAAAPWPDLQAFNQAEVHVGGVPVWGGRIWEAPLSAQAEDVIAVQGRGWQFHLDDDLLQRLYAHTRMGDWIDVRSGYAAATADLSKFTAGWQVGATDGAPTMSWPIQMGNPTAFTYPGLIFDGGYAGACKRIVVTITTPANWSWGAALKLSASDSLPIVPAGGDSTIAGLTGGAISSQTFSVTLATARRYLLLWVDQNATGSPGAESAIRFEKILVVSSTAYESGNASILKASDVVRDVLGSGAVPLLSSSEALIEDTTFSIPEFAPSGYQTPRQLMAAVNDYEANLLGVDLNRQVFFRERATTPLLEVGAWPGSEFSDSSTNSGEGLYNRVIVQATGPDGAELKVSRTASVPLLDRQGFTRTAVLQVASALTQTAAEQLGDIWLSERSTPPLKGTLTIRRGGARLAAGGDVHPSQLLLYVGQRIRLGHLFDPANGGWGRDGTIRSVSYSHEDETATVELDNERGRLEALLSRLAVVTEQVLR